MSLCRPRPAAATTPKEPDSQSFVDTGEAKAANQGPLSKTTALTARQIAQSSRLRVSMPLLWSPCFHRLSWSAPQQDGSDVLGWRAGLKQRSSPRLLQLRVLARCHPFEAVQGAVKTSFLDSPTSMRVGSVSVANGVWSSGCKPFRQLLLVGPVSLQSFLAQPL